MPYLPERILDCVVYLYPSADSAKHGEKAGGSGFLVSVPSRVFPETVDYTYAVTNKHIIEKAKSPVIRINTDDGKFEVFDLAPSAWFIHPTGDDLAICPLGLGPPYKCAHIPISKFLTKDSPDLVKFGAGDEVILLGRFIGHDGVNKNSPSIRSGMISMMPGDPIVQDDGHAQVSYLVECHSIGGYSGSPVFLHIPNYSQRPGGFSLGDQVFLLGIDWGHIFHKEPVLTGLAKKHPDGLYVRRNTGMMGVVPSWVLADFLNHKDIVKTREQNEKRLETRKAEITSESDSAEDVEHFTKADFEAALKKVSKRVQPSQSGEEK